MLIVTGGGTGIGAAIARRAARAGLPVCVNYRSGADQAHEVVDQIRMARGTAIAVAADAGDPDDVERLFATAVAELGPLTALANNAGVTGGTASVMDVEVRQLDDCFHSCLRSVVLCTRAAARTMAVSRGGSGGAIVNISSTAPRTGGSGEWVHYAAVKAAVTAHTLGAAKELAREGIRVNAVAPGLVETDLHADNGMPDRPQRLRSSIPLGRLGRPEE